MLFILQLAALIAVAAAETGRDGWLRYAPLPNGDQHKGNLPKAIVALNNSDTSPVFTAGNEVARGLKGIFDRDVSIKHDSCGFKSSVVIGTVDSLKSSCIGVTIPEIKEDGFWLSIDGPSVKIVGQNERGALYGAFEYLSMVAQGNFSTVDYVTNPDQPIRWVNQWDNFDGTIERGYGGPSIFFANYSVVDNIDRMNEYARLLASIRVNGIVINNVNANATLLTDDNIKGLARIADVFRPWGIPIGLSLSFASPKDIGGLDTFDPLDQKVIDFWKDRSDAIYKKIPDLAGYLVKGDSEGQEGPLTYNRTLADGANLFANAIKEHGGIVMYRAFVYDKLNETDWKADRAKAAYDYFQPLDGKFEDNVVVQIKYGPIDFQVREAISPLFGSLRHTNVAVELQVTQEYLGQQCHLVYLPELWRTVWDFDLRSDNQSTLVSDVVSGRRFNRPLAGSAAVVNVGTNDTWLGSHLSMSNLYAYGRLAWNPNSDSESILKDWIRLTFGLDQRVIDTITKMSMNSWSAYEKYSGNLGIQTLADILYTHFGPNPQFMDGNGWGQWTRSYHNTVGMDRTVENGTGYAGQYPPDVAAAYEDISTTPDELLLWFHHVPYTHQLKSSNKTVIQHFYDSHYEGAEMANEFLTLWESLEDKVDTQRYQETLFRQRYQAGHSIVWRDAINNFYHNISGIPDEIGRVGHHPWRIEAEEMKLDGYKPYKVNPFEMASNFTAIVTSSNTTSGTASVIVPFEDGTYDVAVGYFDLFDGKAQWEATVNNKELGSWVGDNEDHLGHEQSRHLDGHTATRITFKNVQVKKGDELKIKGTPNGIEAAPLDYVAFLPNGIID